MNTENQLPNVHPGEMLLEEFLKPAGLSQVALAKGTGLPPSRINMIISGKIGISADVALRLGRFLRTTPQLWLGLQNEFDLRKAINESSGKLDYIKGYTVAGKTSASVVPTRVRAARAGRASRTGLRTASGAGALTAQ